MDNPLRQFIGKRIYGGCEACDAYQEVEEVGPGLMIIHVFHDEWCPEKGANPLPNRAARRAARRGKN